MTVVEDFKRLFSRSAGTVHVAGKYVSMPQHMPARKVPNNEAAAAQMHVAGSTGLKQLPLVSAEEFSSRKEKAFQYDFSAIG